MPESPTITAVIFDMGGVLVDLGPLNELFGSTPDLTTDEFLSQWLASPAVRSFERGQCSPEDFADELIVELNLSIGAAEFLDRFAAWPKGLMAGAAQMVAGLKNRVDTAVLSNTSALHWQTQVDAAKIQALFDRRYLSFEMGLGKPDPEIFNVAISDLDRPASEVLFLDDNQINVDAARALGITAELTRGVTAANEVLDSHGLGRDLA